MAVGEPWLVGLLSCVAVGVPWLAPKISGNESTNTYGTSGAAPFGSAGATVAQRADRADHTSDFTQTRRGPDPLDTLRFLPLDDDKPMITKYLVGCYTRQFGQDLYMIVNEEERYIDVLFANKESADNVKSKFQDPRHRPPFKMALTNTIDESQLVTPGEFTFYHHPRDLDHDDTQPSLPLGWNNPNPVTFEFPPADVADVVPQAADVAPPADVAAPDAGVARVVQHSNPETAKQSRQPRVKARYPPTVQPPPPSSRPPFDEPEWPTPPTYVP